MLIKELRMKLEAIDYLNKQRIALIHMIDFAKKPLSGKVLALSSSTASTHIQMSTGMDERFFLWLHNELVVVDQQIATLRAWFEPLETAHADIQSP